MKATNLTPTNNCDNELPMDRKILEFSHLKESYFRAQFFAALQGFQKMADQAWTDKDYNHCIECLIYVTRILLEQDRKEELQQNTAKIRHLIESNVLSAKTLCKAHYTIGLLLYSLNSEDLAAARESFNMALEISLTHSDYEGLAHAIYGQALIHYEVGEWDQCLSQLEKVDQILNSVSLADLKMTTHLLRAFLYRHQNQFSKAIRHLENASEQIRNNPNIYLYLQVLYGFGSTLLKMNQHSSALIYLELGNSLCSAAELPRVGRLLFRTLNQCRVEMSTAAKTEIVFRSSTATLERVGHGSVSFLSQFILRDLLTLFLENPGRFYSKEDLVNLVWKEDYSPLVHDNKIYVTLKRLRKSLEPLFLDSELIVRSRLGYGLNNQFTSKVT